MCTVWNLLSAPHDPAADDCMIVGTPGVHLLMQKFSEKREQIRKRNVEKEKSSKKHTTNSRPNVRAIPALYSVQTN